MSESSFSKIPEERKKAALRILMAAAQRLICKRRGLKIAS